MLWSSQMTIAKRGKHASVGAAQFKATCLELIERVRREGGVVAITKRGQPVAQLVPIFSALPDIFGSAPVVIRGDILAPIDDDWDAEG